MSPFQKNDSNVNETELESKWKRNGKTDCDDLSDNSSNENEIIERVMKLKTKISSTHRWIIIMLIMVSHNMKK